MKRIYFSGTVGDAFIAICKLISNPLQEQYELQRVSRISGCDEIIKKLCDLYNINYNENYFHFDEIEDMRRYIIDHQRPFLNIYANGIGEPFEPNDPSGFNFVPFYRIYQKKPREGNRKRIGLQINSGSNQLTSKEFDCSKILEKIISTLGKVDDRFDLFLLGNLSRESLSEITCSRGNIRVFDLVNRQSFTDWLEILASLDRLISFDGLALYFSLAHEVKCLCVYLDEMALVRIHEEWRANVNLHKVNSFIPTHSDSTYKFNVKALNLEYNELNNFLLNYTF